MPDPLTPDQARSLLVADRVVRDPVHGDIRLTDLERRLLDTPELQRLRHVRQLPGVDLVFPGATHTRLLHSLGTLHVTAEMIDACQTAARTAALTPGPAPRGPRPVRVGPYAELVARLTALLHDAAHVPFGHVFEREAQVFARDEWDDPWRVERVFGEGSGVVARVREAVGAVLAAEEEAAGKEKKGEVKRDQKKGIKGQKDDKEEQKGGQKEKIEGKKKPETGQKKLETGQRVPETEASRVAADALLAEVLACVRSGPDDRLRYPFVADLVGRSLCADLVDYVQRDMYFAGLSEGVARRFVAFLAVVPVMENSGADGRLTVFRGPYPDEAAPARDEPDGTRSACRLALLPYRRSRPEGAGVKHNILAEAVDLARRRELVTEKLYFHKTKLAATAMLSAAAHAWGLAGAEALWDRSDREVLRMMAEAPDTGGGNRPRRARILARKLMSRSLLKPIYRASYRRDTGDAAGAALWDRDTGVYYRYDSAERREPLIAALETAIGLHAAGDPAAGVGSVAISCPDKEMQVKEFDLLVSDHPQSRELRRLQDVVQRVVQEEVRVIRQAHLEQWRFEVYVDAAQVPVGSAFARRLAGALQADLGPKNEVYDLEGETVVSLGALIRELRVEALLDRSGLRDRITRKDYEALVALAASLPEERVESALSAQLEGQGYVVRRDRLF